MAHINAEPNANADLSGSDAVNAPVANPNNTANMRFSRFAFLSPICYRPFLFDCVEPDFNCVLIILRLSPNVNTHFQLFFDPVEIYLDFSTEL